MNKDKRNNIKLLGTLNNADESGIIANANQIYDANEYKSTQDVSKEHKERIKTLETKENSMQTTLENITKTGEASAASNVTYNHSDSKLDATNVQQAVDEVSSIGYFAKRGGIVNISTNYNSTNTAEVLTLPQALSKVPSTDRVLGFQGKYLASDGWHTIIYIGDSLTSWSDITKWIDLADKVFNSISINATFGGIATPTTNPGTPDGPVFYIAAEPGIYPNFNGISVADGEAVILEWKESWTKKTTGFATQQQIIRLYEIENNFKEVVEGQKTRIYPIGWDADKIFPALTSGNIGSAMLQSDKSSTGENQWASIKIPIKIGDTFSVNGYSATSSNSLYGLIDASNHLLEASAIKPATEFQSYNNIEVTQENAAYIIVSALVKFQNNSRVAELYVINKDDSIRGEFNNKLKNITSSDVLDTDLQKRQSDINKDSTDVYNKVFKGELVSTEYNVDGINVFSNKKFSALAPANVGIGMSMSDDPTNSYGNAFGAFKIEFKKVNTFSLHCFASSSVSSYGFVDENMKVLFAAELKGGENTYNDITTDLEDVEYLIGNFIYQQANVVKPFSLSVSKVSSNSLSDEVAQNSKAISKNTEDIAAIQKGIGNVSYHPNEDILAEKTSEKNCKLQKSVGRYYFPSTFSANQPNNVKTYLDGRGKFGKSVRIELHDYASGGEVTTATERATITFNFDKKIECKETLSFWINCLHKYIAEPFRYDSKEQSLEVYNPKKEQAFSSIKIIPYLNGIEQSAGTQEINITNYQSKVSILSSSAGQWHGWGYKAPSIMCDILGWKLLKIPKLVAIKFDRLDFVIKTFDNHPNMELNIGHIVTDQKMMPVLVPTKDGFLSAENSIIFARWLNKNNIPISCGGAYLESTDKFIGMTETEKEGNRIAKDMYYRNLLEVSPYNRDLKNYGYEGSIEYLNNAENSWSPFYGYKNYETFKEVISMNTSVVYLDELLINASKKVGFKIFRGSGMFDTGGTSYLDTIDAVMYCGNLMNDVPASLSEENYDTIINSRTQQGKKAIDKMIQLGECKAYLTHHEAEKEDAIANHQGSLADALRNVLSYAKEKQEQGELLILTTRQLYELCCEI